MRRAAVTLLASLLAAPATAQTFSEPPEANSAGPPMSILPARTAKAQPAPKLPPSPLADRQLLVPAAEAPVAINIAAVVAGMPEPARSRPIITVRTASR